MNSKSNSPMRAQESMAARFTAEEKSPHIILTASSDVGVIRNGGRVGSRWAPQALRATLAKMTITHNLIEGNIAWHSVSEQQTEEQDFIKAQALEACAIKKHLQYHPKRLIHLGGGHDHVLPLLQALDSDILVLNIDAHCDTRIDQEPHSGNPFRLWSTRTSHQFEIFQWGIHPFANSASTLSALSRGSMHILTMEEIAQGKAASFWQQFSTAAKNAKAIVFSLDCDALHSADMEAVSAVNHNGIPLANVVNLVRQYQALCEQLKLPQYYGVYEFNPLYDSVSSRSARSAACLLQTMLSR